MEFIRTLTQAFASNSSRDHAQPMEQYMKNRFSFYGIKTEARRSLLKDLWSRYQDDIQLHSREIAMQLYACQEREMHYCAIEILIKTLKKHYRLDDIALIEKLITTHSWWDSVDTIAKFILGEYLREFPDEIPAVIDRFSNAQNIWLNRSALLFQLGYKQKTDRTLLFALCKKHRHSKEFFIQKAIGWALREYGRYEPDEVKAFVLKTELKPLSKKEALKNIS